MRRVAVFVPCTVDLFLPSVAEAAFSLLRRLGIEPVYHQEQTCCGQPAVNSGYRKEARKMAKHFLEVFSNDEEVVGLSGSCIFTVTSRYPDLFTDEPEWSKRAQQLASRMYELSQYVVDVLGVEDVGAFYEGKVAYHSSCQLYRGLGVSEQPKKLIRAVKGAELLPMEREEMCCGFGGEFSASFPRLSEAMVSEKAASYLASGADVLVACEPGCLLNIGGYLSRNHPDKKAIHIAELLAGGQQIR